jgi:hypothetical protein
VITLISDHGWDTIAALGVLTIFGFFTWLLSR